MSGKIMGRGKKNWKSMVSRRGDVTGAASRCRHEKDSDLEHEPDPIIGRMDEQESLCLQTDHGSMI